MKKLLAIITAFVLAVTLATSVLAADATGKITVENAQEGQSYKLYRLALLESYADENYSYQPEAAWLNFFKAYPQWFTLTDDGYLLMNGSASVSVEEAVAFSRAALAYAKEKNIDATVAGVADGDGKVVFQNLPLGYYLLDSAVGTLCTLDTGTADLTIHEKNSAPSITKQVQEDSDGSWGQKNDADFYQVVNFKTTITAQAGAQNYVLHDTMVGMELAAGTVKVYAADGTTPIDEANYSVATETEDGCSFEVVFTQAFCDTLQKDQQLVVCYSATLHETSVVDGEGNPNSTYMTYGESSRTTTHSTVTYVYEFDLVKTDEDDVLLPGAQFRIFDAEVGGNEILVVKEADGSYRVAKAGENGEAIVVTDGRVTVTGLDGGTTYYLEETKAPDGYNKLAARTPVEIRQASVKATDTNGAYNAGTGVQVVNRTGKELPQTGGPGTLILCLLGGTSALGAGVLLVTKKRVSGMEE